MMGRTSLETIAQHGYRISHFGICVFEPCKSFTFVGDRNRAGEKTDTHRFDEIARAPRAIGDSDIEFYAPTLFPAGDNLIEREVGEAQRPRYVVRGAKRQWRERHVASDQPFRNTADCAIPTRDHDEVRRLVERGRPGVVAALLIANAMAVLAQQSFERVSVQLIVIAGIWIVYECNAHEDCV